MNRASTVPADAELRAGRDGATLSFVLAPGYRFFEGHFEGRPIVPAVAQIGWIVEALKAATGIEVSNYSIQRCKFTRPLEPGDSVEVSCRPVAGGYLGEVSVDGAPACSARIKTGDAADV